MDGEAVDLSNGQIAHRLDYDEFGKVTLDTNPGFQPFGFAGGLYDRDIGKGAGKLLPEYEKRINERKRNSY